MRVIDSVAPLTIAIAMMVAIAGAIELAFVIGKRRPLPESADVPIVRSGLLSLIGLLLAFSFSIADARYEQRRQLVIDEANAIGTTHLRAGFCGEPTRTKLRDALLRYVDVRLEQASLAVDSEGFRAVDLQRERATTEIWAIAETEFTRDPHATTTATLVQSLNQAIDLAATRREVHRNRMPQSVLLLLFISAIAGGFAIGYQPGSHVNDRRFGAIFCVVVGLLFYAILDLDTPGRGLIRVPSEPLVELRASMVTSSAPTSK